MLVLKVNAATFLGGGIFYLDIQKILFNFIPSFTYYTIYTMGQTKKLVEDKGRKVIKQGARVMVHTQEFSLTPEQLNQAFHWLNQQRLGKN